ncbi:MAG: phosphatidylglycerophosphatase A [Verrucomicrobia bacterium]|jgi:phosphatidylglycerophosphatase A|nr:phosphatidylglycerophosphatase A [Verrucomicrobiota bacterium]
MQPLLERLLLLVRMLPDRTVLGICRCGPLGTVRKGPGTVGSLGGLALYTLFFFPLGLFGQLLLLLPLIGLAIPFCEEGERRLGKRDPGEIVLDEVVAVPLCFLGLSGAIHATGMVWLYMLLGFGFFRLYDILKPFGINRLQRYTGGLGVVLDDLGAAVATNATLVLFLFAFRVGGWG